MKVLIVEDDELNRITLTDALMQAGFQVSSCENGREVMEQLSTQEWDLIVTDLKMPYVDGMELLNHVQKTHPEVAVIIITAFGTIERAVEAMKAGAYDFITKPFTGEELVLKVRKFQKYRELERENIQLRKDLGERFQFHNLIGKHPSMQKIYETIEQIADSESTVLVLGESGTGKELTAKAIHYNSPRKKGPFVAVSCAAIPENLLESQLFGYKKGAFTDAKTDKPGKFDAAEGGTLFLDDVDAMPQGLQAKLLRALQEKEIEPLGANVPKKVNVRVLASAKSNLQELVAEQKFREDLYYRLNVLCLSLPALRSRREDIPLLVDTFIKKYAPKIKPRVRNISPEALKVLMSHSFPGNVRELEHLIEGSLHFAKGEEITLQDLPREISQPNNHPSSLDVSHFDPSKDSFPDLMERAERDFFIWALKQTEWNVSKAAELLKIPRTTLQDKIRRYNLAESPV